MSVLALWLVLTQVEMHNVKLHLDETLTVHMREIVGKLLPTRRAQPPTFDDKHSFILEIDSGEVAVGMHDLTYLMNRYVFGYSGAPIKKLTVTAEGQQIKQKGELHKGVDLPFEIVGEVRTTPEGKIRIHPTRVKAAHIPVKGVMGVFGIRLKDLIDTRNARGVRVEENDLILDPEQMLPPPRMRGRITRVRIEGDQLIQTFGDGHGPRGKDRNLMHFVGGVIRFGKLTMNNADLALIDAQPADAFEFYLDRYKEQLVAGYSKTTPTFGLEVFMPDLAKIRVPQASRRRASRAAK